MDENNRQSGPRTDKENVPDNDADKIYAQPIKFMRSKRKTARRKAARRTPPARTATELKTIIQPPPRQKAAKTPPRKIKIPPPTLNTAI